MPTTLRPIASRHLTRRKKCDDFWYPGAESFPTIYSMNDFATKFFNRYHTLSYCEFSTQYVQRPMKNFIPFITLDDIHN